MPGARRLRNRTYVQLPHWEYLGGEVLAPDSTTTVAATLPSECTIVLASVETQGVYYAINNAVVSATSPGYIPEDNAILIGPLSNLNTLSFHGDNATASAVHLSYFKEV